MEQGGSVFPLGWGSALLGMRIPGNLIHLYTTSKQLPTPICHAADAQLEHSSLSAVSYEDTKDKRQIGHYSLLHENPLMFYSPFS